MGEVGARKKDNENRTLWRNIIRFVGSNVGSKKNFFFLTTSELASNLSYFKRYFH